MVIGYELVSYLLLYSSVHCVTFKELFVCKGSNFIGTFDVFHLFFHLRFSVKAILFVGTPSYKRILNDRVPTSA